MDVPGGARASAAGFEVWSVKASLLLFRRGGGLTSQRIPYIAESDDDSNHVSCPYAEKFVRRGDRLLPEKVPTTATGAIPVSGPAAPWKSDARTYGTGPYTGSSRL